MTLNMYILTKKIVESLCHAKIHFSIRYIWFEKYTSKNMFSLTLEKLNQRPNKNMSLATFVETMV
jgi:hypothetical protein